MTRVLVLLLLSSMLPAAAHDCNPSECRRVKQEIRKIEARMRQPYSAKQGVRYDEKLRRLKRRRNRVCC